ncbi:MAG: ribosomal protein S18-alanine N-acetyltransferase [Streptococcaceae bacterium]|jgi:ribosomal-protein-alanine N-acetyltransferase|nr:ribosomal protein S18-alanine N-acetyltransferase [Streptococcaceae bacterium]
MVRIRQVNVLTDCYRDLAVAIQTILAENDAPSAWTFEQTFADLLRDDTVYYLAFSEAEELVGFLALSVVMDESELTNLAVSPAFQGQGIASLLLQQLAEMPGKLFLEVRAANHTARHLYDKFGFEAYYRRQDYYQNPREDAILMKRET